jgi:uncharacterized protein
MSNRFDLPSPAVDKIRSTLAAFPQIERAVLFGSRAKGVARRGSDIDLALFGAGLDSRTLARIEDAMDDLLLPYRVDLLVHDRITHADLLDHIARVGIPFYEQAGMVAK